MSAHFHKLISGARVLIKHCDECGSDQARFGFHKLKQPSRWYCRAHMHIGIAWLKESAQ